jgi:RNA polymerase sigma-70 factor (ECF subfamily)
MTPVPGTGEGLRASAAAGSPPDLSPGDTEDFQWIRDFQAGGEQGFNRLVLKHKDRVYGLCLRLLAGNRYDAEDVAQESFVKAYHGLRGFRMEAKFSSWMYRIAVNACKNKLASRHYQEARRHRDLDGAEGEGAPSAPSPAQVFEAKRERERIEEAIARLPEEQRTLVVLRDVEGRSYEEIAESTGLNPGTVKSRLNRGRGQLREWLKDCFLPALSLAIGWMVKVYG